MKKTIGIIIIAVVVICGALLVYLVTQGPSTPTPPSPDPTPGTKDIPPNIIPAGKKDQTNVIRIGYHTAALINGQMGQVLKHTNVLKKNNLKGKVKGFTDEVSLRKALKTRQIDVILTFDLSAIICLGTGIDGLLIGTLGPIGRNGLVTPTESDINSIQDLRGKKIGVTLGSAGHRDLLAWLSRKGLQAEKDVELSDMNEAEIEAALESKSIDAFVVSDPLLEKYCRRKLGNEKEFTIRADDRNYSFILIRRDYRNNNPYSTLNFIRALKETVLFMAKNKVEINKRFAAESKINPDLIWACSATNSNYNRTTKIDEVKIVLSNPYIGKLQRNIAFIQGRKIGTVPDLLKAIEPALKQISDQKIDPAQYNPASVRFIK